MDKKKILKEVYGLEKEVEKLNQRIEKLKILIRDEKNFLSEEEYIVYSTVSYFEVLLKISLELEYDLLYCFQSVIFPSIYNRLLNDNKNYYIHKIPHNYKEIIISNKELLTLIRDDTDKSLLNKETYKEYFPLIENHLKTSVFPLIYGGTDPKWSLDDPLPLESMKEWIKDRTFIPSIHDLLLCYNNNKTEILRRNGLMEFIRTL